MKTFLDICEVEVIDHNNDDLTVVNAARVSNSKRVERLVTSSSPSDSQSERKAKGISLDDSLINFLAKNGHWTPFAQARHGFACPIAHDFDWTAFLKWAGNETKRAGFKWRFYHGEDANALLIHGSAYGWLANTPPVGLSNLRPIFAYLFKWMPLTYVAFATEPPPEVTPAIALSADSVTLRVKAPLFLFRQLMRSNIGLVYNETSRRYVDDVPEIHDPSIWRARPDKSIKQGSGADLDDISNARIDERYTHHVEESARLYYDMINMGVAPEMARMALPQSMVTELWMTSTHEAIHRILGLRLGKDGKNQPQREIVEFATALRDELGDRLPMEN